MRRLINWLKTFRGVECGEEISLPSLTSLDFLKNGWSIILKVLGVLKHQHRMKAVLHNGVFDMSNNMILKMV